MVSQGLLQMSVTVKPESQQPTSTQIPTEPMAHEEEALENADPNRRFLWFQAAPAWLVSMLVHVLVLLVLGLVTFADPIKIVNVLSANYVSEEGPEIEEFTIEEIDPGEISEMEEDDRTGRRRRVDGIGRTDRDGADGDCRSRVGHERPGIRDGTVGCLACRPLPR